MGVVQVSHAVVLTREQYRNLIEQNQFLAEHTNNVGHAEKGRILANIRNAHTMSDEITIREAFREIANGSIYLRAELNYISDISRTRNELLFNLHYMSEAYFSLTNDQRLEDDVVTRARYFFNLRN